jgi:spore germination protein YaaH/putative cell wall-binding protein
VGFIKTNMVCNSKKSKQICVFLLVLVLFFASNAWMSGPVNADALLSESTRLAGQTRYETAVKISQAGWQTASSVVLARGDDFPDALAGSVLANSANVNGPLLLTESTRLTPVVLAEILRLQAQTVYILGGTGAISSAVETTLINNNFRVIRIQGKDRYETASAITLEAVPTSSEAFLASGLSFADTLSVSSYAAAKGIPLLLTETAKIPSTTLQTLKKLGVKTVTLIGGDGVIEPQVAGELQRENFAVKRYSGANRYQTNISVLNSLAFNTDKFYVATGNDFPDALSGAVLASKDNCPIVLVPSQNLDSTTLSFITARREAGASFTLLGGWGVISYGMESIIRTGSTHPRISLQYVQGPSFTSELSQLSTIPGRATDYVDIVAPDWYSLADSNGNVVGDWDQSQNNYSQFVSGAHGRNLKVLPLVNSSWESTAAIDGTLQNSVAQSNLINQLMQRVMDTGVDGIVVDFEYMKNEDGPYLTTFMRNLYARMSAANKMVVIAVMARTSPTAEPWLAKFNYFDLAQYADYLNVMTYDYSTTSPGPIAPLPWVRRVLDYTKSQGVDMNKVLLGIPYYGRDWTTSPDSKVKAIGLAQANMLIGTYGVQVQREASPDDPIGIPYFTYNDGSQHIVYYDDLASWQEKLSLLDRYHIGGIGSWSLYWLKDSSPQLFSLLNERLR